MKQDELKLRITTLANSLIDEYFHNNNLVESLANSTLKLFLKSNIDKIDGLLKMFADDNGNIDAEMVISTYAEQLGNGMKLDIRDYIKNDFIRDILPDKAIVIDKDDVMKIINQNNNVFPITLT